MILHVQTIISLFYDSKIVSKKIKGFERVANNTNIEIYLRYLTVEV